MFGPSNWIGFAWTLFVANGRFPIRTIEMQKLKLNKNQNWRNRCSFTHFSDSSITNLLKICCVGSVTPEMLCFKLRNLSIMPAISSLQSVWKEMNTINRTENTNEIACSSTLYIRWQCVDRIGIFHDGAKQLFQMLSFAVIEKCNKNCYFFLVVPIDQAPNLLTPRVCQ